MKGIDQTHRSFEDFFDVIHPYTPVSAEYTAELMNVLNVLGWLVELEPAQDDLLTRICAGPLIAADDLAAAGTRRATRPGAGGGDDPRQTKLL